MDRKRASEMPTFAKWAIIKAIHRVIIPGMGSVIEEARMIAKTRCTGRRTGASPAIQWRQSLGSLGGGSDLAAFKTFRRASVFCHPRRCHEGSQEHRRDTNPIPKAGSVPFHGRFLSASKIKAATRRESSVRILPMQCTSQVMLILLRFPTVPSMQSENSAYSPISFLGRSSPGSLDWFCPSGVVESDE